LLTSNNQCAIVVTVTTVPAHATGAGLYSSYVPSCPQRKALRAPVRSAKRSHNWSKPTICRSLR